SDLSAPLFRFGTPAGAQRRWCLRSSMLSTSRRTPRSHDSSVLPRMSTDFAYSVSPVATLFTSMLRLRIRLLTFCTQHRATRSAPSALAMSSSQPLHPSGSCEDLSTRYMPRASSSRTSCAPTRARRRSVSRRASSLESSRIASIRPNAGSASDLGSAAPAAPQASAARSSITPMAAARIGVMLVDDHAVVRMGFRLLLDAAPDMRVIAEADSGEEAMRRLDEARPEVVVMDISMPGIGGLEAVRRILARDPAARILV